VSIGILQNPVFEIETGRVVGAKADYLKHRQHIIPTASKDSDDHLPYSDRPSAQSISGNDTTFQDMNSVFLEANLTADYRIYPTELNDWIVNETASNTYLGISRRPHPLNTTGKYPSADYDYLLSQDRTGAGQ